VSARRTAFGVPDVADLQLDVVREVLGLAGVAVNLSRASAAP